MGIKLKQIRKKRGLTQEQVASELGVKTSRYGDWERGTHAPTLEQARDCAIVLKCTIDEIADHDVSSYPNQQSVLLEHYKSLNSIGRDILLRLSSYAHNDPSMC